MSKEINETWLGPKQEDGYEGTINSKGYGKLIQGSKKDSLHRCLQSLSTCQVLHVDDNLTFLHFLGYNYIQSLTAGVQRTWQYIACQLLAVNPDRVFDMINESLCFLQPRSDSRRSTHTPFHQQ